MAGAVDHVVAADQVAAVVEQFELSGVEALMLHLLDDARLLADPPISDYYVGIVGRENETGDLVLGGNLEFPGAHLGATVHGEGFVMTRAFQRGTTIGTLALRRAHPCAHCRQYIAEFSAAADLTLIDTLGHRLTMTDIYPWPFSPGALGEAPAVPGAIAFPTLTADGPDLLIATGQRSWAPYSGFPGAVVLEMADGSTAAGASVESVAFNPSMPPLQAALVAARAGGHVWADITAATLGTVVGGAVDHSRQTADLLAVIAPTATLTVIPWRL